MADPVFGISIRRIDDESRPAFPADLSTIGIIGPADGADPLTFPLNTPVHVNSDQTFKLRKLGTLGYIPDAIEGINAQLGEMQFAARIVVVRTASGTNADDAIKLQQTINNISGSSINRTGIWAFTKSAQLLGFTPRILVAPGYTGQMATGIGNMTRTLGGVGYVEGRSYPITFAGGGPNAVQATGHALGLVDGSLGPIELDTPGAWYTTNPTATAPFPGSEITAAAIASAGSAYAVGDTLSFADGVILTVATITGGGATGPIATFTITDPGFVDQGVATPTNPRTPFTTSGQGTGATVNFTWGNSGTRATYTVDTLSNGANPVVANLTAVLNQLIGHAIVESTGTSEENDFDWRETFQSLRLIPVSGGVRVMDPNTSFVVFRPLAPRVAGLLVRRDHETGAPFHSAANQPIQGIIGPGRDITYALTDSANEAQELLAANIGVVVRGQIGDDFAIASGGFIFIGTDTASEDELWRFYNVSRGRDFIHLTLLRALRYFLGRYNISVHTIVAIENTMKGILRDLYADEHILGYAIEFPAASNSADEIRAGHVTIGFRAEEPPVLRHLTVESRRFRNAIDTMVGQLAAQLAFTTA